ncbi:hypothetical protein [Pseudomonas sp. AP19]|jgi:hypothetical protein|uniref:hypothetical protein n=1 Tax=Pseudomonas sp. AP19 TaxID=1535623 RepID=UPI00114CE966|nr:hypothetical protein [Pseudomonas sp. AP19]
MGRYSAQFTQTYPSWTGFSQEEARALVASASLEIPLPAKADPTVRTPTEPSRELSDKTVQLLKGSSLRVCFQGITFRHNII